MGSMHDRGSCHKWWRQPTSRKRNTIGSRSIENTQNRYAFRVPQHVFAKLFLLRSCAEFPFTPSDDWVDRNATPRIKRPWINGLSHTAQLAQTPKRLTWKICCETKGVVEDIQIRAYVKHEAQEGVLALPTFTVACMVLPSQNKIRLLDSA